MTAQHVDSAGHYFRPAVMHGLSNFSSLCMRQRQSLVHSFVGQHLLTVCSWRRNRVVTITSTVGPGSRRTSNAPTFEFVLRLFCTYAQHIYLWSDRYTLHGGYIADDVLAFTLVGEIPVNAQPTCKKKQKNKVFNVLQGILLTSENVWWPLFLFTGSLCFHIRAHSAN